MKQNKMIRAIFFDIDGTLIDTTTHTIPASTILALRLLRANGYKTAIASGRDMKTIKTIEGLDLSLFDGFVASNGMCIFNEAANCIQKHAYAPEIVTELLTYANLHHMTLIFETLDDIYTANEVNDYVAIANAYYQETTPVRKQWQGEDIVKITAFQKQHYDFTSLIQKIDIQIFPAPTTTYDFTIPGISKLSGITEMMTYWKLPTTAFACFGDHENDIEMVKGAALGIAVKDALGSKKLQDIADVVCESAKEDGLYRCLKHLKWI